MIANILKRELRNLKSPLYRNSVYISLASLTTAIAGFLFWAIAARVYPADDVGIASAVVSALNLTFNLSMLGMNFAIIRFYPEYRERAVGSALFITSIAGVIFSVIYGIVMLSSRAFNALGWRFFVFFVIFSLVGTSYNILYTYSIARRQAEYGFVQSIVFSGRFLLLFLLGSMGALGIISSFGLGLLFGLGCGVLLIGVPSIRLDRGFIREAFRFSLGNYIANIANIAPNYLMPSLVLNMLGKEETAYFYIAFTIGNLILFVPNAVNISFFVEGSHELNHVKKFLKKVLSISYIYLIGATVFVWLFGEFILRLFGEEYVHGVFLLRLMILGDFFAIIVNFLITLLNIQKRVRWVVLINTSKALLFLGLSYLLIPRMGITGVGWGWVGAYALVSVSALLLFNSR